MFGTYEYSMGNLVQLVRHGPVYAVIWRGQLKIRNREGWVQRAPVYRLDNGFWDCSYEAELHVLGR